MKAKGIKLKTAKKSAGTVSRSAVRKAVAAVYSGAVTSSGRVTRVLVTTRPISTQLTSAR